MKKTILTLLLASILAAPAAWAINTSIIGGYRSGFELGIITDDTFPGFIFTRFGVALKTDQDNPMIILLARNFWLSKYNAMPLALRLGLIGYFGNNTIGGITTSLMFDNFLKGQPASLEMGFDFVGNEIDPFVQVGWKLP